MNSPRDRLNLAAWRAAYRLEEAREAHADAGRYWHSGWCCFGLALLRLGRFTQ